MALHVANPLIVDGPLGALVGVPGPLPVEPVSPEAGESVLRKNFNMAPFLSKSDSIKSALSQLYLYAKTERRRQNRKCRGMC